LVVLAATVRLWGLSSPPRPVFDERYYAPDAYDYLGGGYVGGHPDDPSYRIEGEVTWVHPPMGKWMIALLGEGPFGFRPFGWRFPSALFGVAGVLALYWLALALWGSVWWAALAGLLLALDGLHIVQSRVAMLEVFLVTFATSGILLLVLDRRRPRRANRWVDRTFGSPLRLGAGVLLGAAVATKWSGLLALGLGIGLALVWRRDSGRIRVGPLIAPLVLVPLAVYLLAYAPWFVRNGPDLPRFGALQARMLQHQVGPHESNPAASSPLVWPVLGGTIRYDPPPAPGGPSAHGEIVLVGNPVLWWGFLLLLPALVVAARRRGAVAERLALAGVLVMYLPWLVASRQRYLYYALPMVPFMVLGMTGAIRSWGRTPERRRVLGVAVAGATALAAAAYLPVWLGLRAGGWPGFRLPGT
jgi:dolichyl-phosphate-mannose--protein O-mannosyl transferase